VKVILGLPAYNEEQGLPRLLEVFQREMGSIGLDARVVIVDDGSTDRTYDVAMEWASRLPLDLVRHSENRGLGETIRDTLRKATELAEDEDIIVTMDADNTHDPALIPDMMRVIDSGKGVVIASRYRAGAQVVGLSSIRHVMSLGARVLFQMAFPIRGVRDYTCGFRAYRAGVLRKAFEVYKDSLVTERSFSCMAEILIKLAKMRVDMAEIAMVLRYDQKRGASKMRVASTVFKTFCLVVRTRFGSRLAETNR
jgi:dolichol-phosphate mannosyltransferase